MVPGSPECSVHANWTVMLRGTYRYSNKDSSYQIRSYMLQLRTVFLTSVFPSYIRTYATSPTIHDSRFSKRQPRLLYTNCAPFFGAILLKAGDTSEPTERGASRVEAPMSSTQKQRDRGATFRLSWWIRMLELFELSDRLVALTSQSLDSYRGIRHGFRCHPFLGARVSKEVSILLCPI